MISGHENLLFTILCSCDIIEQMFEYILQKRKENAMWQSKSTDEREFYRREIIKMMEKIENPAILKRIYQLIEYLYIHEKEKE